MKFFRKYLLLPLLKSNRRTLGILFVLFLVITVPITLNIVQHQQTTQQHAAGSGSCTLSTWTVSPPQNGCAAGTYCVQFGVNYTAMTAPEGQSWNFGDGTQPGYNNSTYQTYHGYTYQSSPQTLTVSLNAKENNNAGPNTAYCSKTIAIPALSGGNTTAPSVTYIHLSSILNGNVPVAVSGTTDNYKIYITSVNPLTNNVSATQIPSYNPSQPLSNSTFYYIMTLPNGAGTNNTEFTAPSTPGTYYVEVNGIDANGSGCAWNSQTFGSGSITQCQNAGPQSFTVGSSSTPAGSTVSLSSFSIGGDASPGGTMTISAINGNANTYRIYISSADPSTGNVKSTNIPAYNPNIQTWDNTTFYLVSTINSTSTTFQAPQQPGTYYISMNAENLDSSSNSGSGCSWNQELYTRTNGSVSNIQSPGTCKNVGPQSFFDSSSSNTGGNGGNTGGNGGNTGGNGGNTGGNGGNTGGSGNNTGGNQGGSGGGGYQNGSGGGGNQGGVGGLLGQICQYMPYFCPNATASPTVSPTVGPSNGPTGGTTGTQQQGNSTATLNLSVSIPGIGNGPGDNTAPLHTTRTATVQFFDTNNNHVKDFTATLTYSSNDGMFEGNLPVDIPTGYYTVKLNVPGSLVKRVPGVVDVSGTQTISPISLVMGDLNGNNVMDISDYQAFINCYNGTQCADPSQADFNDDGKVDIVDYNILLRSFAIHQGD